MTEQFFYIELEQSPGGSWKRHYKTFTDRAYAERYAKAFARHHWAFGVRVAEPLPDCAAERAARYGTDERDEDAADQDWANYAAL